jgi:hypothetical protein
MCYNHHELPNKNRMRSPQHVLYQLLYAKFPYTRGASLHQFTRVAKDLVTCNRHGQT